MSDQPEAQVPGINPELIASYFNHADREFGLNQLLTVFDYLRRATLRAEDLSRAYLDQIIKFERQKVGELCQSETLPARQPPVRQQLASKSPISKSTKPLATTEHLDLDLSL